jgi:hypothetical protein
MQPPVTHQSNRDDLRFNLRAKISKQDYVDKEMKTSYYYKASNNPTLTATEYQSAQQLQPLQNAVSNNQYN